MTDFFDYICNDCNKPFCELIHLMNLALDQLEEEYCLECLASKHGDLKPEEFYGWIKEYIMKRDCFKTVWEKFDFALCPRIVDKSCFCKVN